MAREEARFSCPMTKKTEGWIDLPHGGFSMGLLADLALHHLSATLTYPLTFDFRLGGSRVCLGDTVDFTASRENEGIAGHGTVHDQPLPYIEFSCRFGSHESTVFFLPDVINHEEGVPLPNYRDCLVCGTERTHPGLKRKFFFVDHLPGKPVFSPVHSRDTNFYQFSRDGILHPLPVLALLDEILGWGGFMLTASGAVTVSLKVILYRSVMEGEELIFFGQGARVRGKPGRRLMFWATGGALSKKTNGGTELVASAEGQFFGLEALTLQMKEHLQPQKLAAQAFRAAGGTFP